MRNSESYVPDIDENPWYHEWEILEDFAREEDARRAQQAKLERQKSRRISISVTETGSDTATEQAQVDSEKAQAELPEAQTEQPKAQADLNQPEAGRVMPATPANSETSGSKPETQEQPLGAHPVWYMNKVTDAQKIQELRQQFGIPEGKEVQFVSGLWQPQERNAGVSFQHGTASVQGENSTQYSYYDPADVITQHTRLGYDLAVPKGEALQFAANGLTELFKEREAYEQLASERQASGQPVPERPPISRKFGAMETLLGKIYGEGPEQADVVRQMKETKQYKMLKLDAEIEDVSRDIAVKTGIARRERQQYDQWRQNSFKNRKKIRQFEEHNLTEGGQIVSERELAQLQAHRERLMARLAAFSKRGAKDAAADGVDFDDADDLGNANGSGNPTNGNIDSDNAKSNNADGMDGNVNTNDAAESDIDTTNRSKADAPEQPEPIIVDVPEDKRKDNTKNAARNKLKGDAASTSNDAEAADAKNGNTTMADDKHNNVEATDDRRNDIDATDSKNVAAESTADNKHELDTKKPQVIKYSREIEDPAEVAAIRQQLGIDPGAKGWVFEQLNEQPIFLSAEAYQGMVPYSTNRLDREQGAFVPIGQTKEQFADLIDQGNTFAATQLRHALEFSLEQDGENKDLQKAAAEIAIYRRTRQYQAGLLKAEIAKLESQVKMQGKLAGGAETPELKNVQKEIIGKRAELAKVLDRLNQDKLSVGDYRAQSDQPVTVLSGSLPKEEEQQYRMEQGIAQDAPGHFARRADTGRLIFMNDQDKLTYQISNDHKVVIPRARAIDEYQRQIEAATTPEQFQRAEHLGEQIRKEYSGRQDEQSKQVMAQLNSIRSGEAFKHQDAELGLGEKLYQVKRAQTRLALAQKAMNLVNVDQAKLDNVPLKDRRGFNYRFQQDGVNKRREDTARDIRYWTEQLEKLGVAVEPAEAAGDTNAEMATSVETTDEETATARAGTAEAAGAANTTNAETSPEPATQNAA